MMEWCLPKRRPPPPRVCLPSPVKPFSRLAEHLLVRQAVKLGLAPSSTLGALNSSSSSGGGGSSSSGSGSGSGGINGNGEASSSSGGGGSSSGGSGSSRAVAASLFSGIYAVGDNPAADVRGANTAGTPWVSVLVRTGVWQGQGAKNSETDPAHVAVDDVLGAVQAGLHRTRLARWHSMR
jgi:hypothetical protein